MLTTSMAMRPVPRRRSGRHRPSVEAGADRRTMTIASTVAQRPAQHGPQSLRNQATRAPNVTISPWAKFVSPVVPKIERQADGAHGDDQAEPDALDEQLERSGRQR